MLQPNFNPFPEIKTARLELLALETAHAPDMFALRTNLQAMQYLGKPIPTSIDEIYPLLATIKTAVNENTGITWGIKLQSKNAIIGTMGFHKIYTQHYRAEIGYMMLPEFWGNGYMSEVMEAVLKYAFETLKLHSIEAVVEPNNEKSIALLTKFGFVKEAHFRENFCLNGVFSDTAVYSLIR